MKLQFSGISSAGWATSIATNLGIAFDMGISASFNLGCDVVLISHAHLDHIHALDIHIMRRTMRGSVGEVLVICSPGDYDLIQARLSLRPPGLELSYKLIAVAPGERVHLKGKLWAIPFKTCHTEPHSQGYLVYEVRQKLLAAFSDTPGPALAALKKSGTTITEEVVVPLVAYTGDTTPSVWRKQSPVMTLVREAGVVITECTFICGEETPEDAYIKGHSHAADLLEFRKRGYMGVKNLVLHHFSRRYSARQIMKEDEALLSPLFRDTKFILPDDNVWEFEFDI